LVNWVSKRQQWSRPSIRRRRK